MAEFVPREMKENLAVTICAVSTLRFMIFRIETANRKNFENVNEPMEDHPGRYVYYFKSLVDAKWYEFDVCAPQGKAQPLPQFDEGDRIVSQFLPSVLMSDKIWMSETILRSCPDWSPGRAHAQHKYFAGDNIYDDVPLSMNVFIYFLYESMCVSCASDETVLY